MKVKWTVTIGSKEILMITNIGMEELEGYDDYEREGQVEEMIQEEFNENIHWEITQIEWPLTKDDEY